MSHEFITQSTFFSRMDEFGFFDAIESRLPEEFTLVFEIARILEDNTKPLSKHLAPILYNKSDDTPPENSPEKHIIPHLPAAEEYEAALIDSYREVARIYPHQFLLPDEVFYQKLVERSLWLPKPKAPRNYRYQAESDQFAPDSRKQKVYLLFDTSKSMQDAYRIHLAKAIAFFFLRQNMKELGTVYFRTFDAEIGKLHVASNMLDFEHLISELMHVRALGRGTALEKALSIAMTDIQTASTMAEAEILVITDGAAHINLEKIRPMMGNNITINTVKIGTATITPDPKFIKDLILTSTSDDAKTGRMLHQKLRDLEHQITNAGSESRKNLLKGELGHLAKQINTLTERVGKKVGETYGKEIELISSTFIQINDLELKDVFELTPEKSRELYELTEEMLEVIKTEPTIEDMKKAALLSDHLEMMAKHQGLESEDLQRKARELEQLLDQMLKEGGDIYHTKIELSEKDEIQLSKMLQKKIRGVTRIPLARLLKIILRRIKRLLKNILTKK